MLNGAQLKAVEGAYTLKAAQQVKVLISNEGSQTYAKLTGQPKIEIYPETELDFFYTAVNAKIRFSKNERGTVTG